MVIYEVFYEDDKGAFCTKSVYGEVMEKFVGRLRREATIKCRGREVGQVWKDGNRWQWCYENIEDGDDVDGEDELFGEGLGL